MTNHSSIEHERESLLKEHEQVQDELNHLRELMQTEVDIEIDEGDSEVFEREKNAALIAVLENYYDPADGGVFVPDVLKPYMGGIEKIVKVA